jgi:hypothetical protein
MKIKVPACRHLKTNGTQCQSPSMEYSEYCYFHERLHQRHKNYRFSQATEQAVFPAFGVRLHALEDAESIQLAISLVVNALAIGNLETQRATAILYGLQLASSNVRNLAEPKPHEIVREIATTHDGLDRASQNTFLNLTTGTQQDAATISSCSLPDENPALPPGKD